MVRNTLAWGASAMHFDEQMGFKFWGLGSTVFFTIKLEAPHSRRFDSIVFLAGGRHTAELGWAALGSHLETNIWHFAEVFATC